MAKDHFFQLRVPFVKVDESQFGLALKTSGYIRNTLYEPSLLEEKTIDNVAFENVSLSKTVIRKVTFKNCTFKNCLFIGTCFEDVSFHSCDFIACNFFRAEFKRVYGKPAQFARAIRKHGYANVAVGLFQQLRENYANETQPEFRREAEYYFRVWSRRLKWRDISRGRTRFRSALSWGGSVAYGMLFGYGYRLRNLLITTAFVVLMLTCAAHFLHNNLFVENGATSIARSLYFTISTMVTMGAVGFTPHSNFGYLFVLLNACFGVVLITATVSAIAKRVSR